MHSSASYYHISTQFVNGNCKPGDKKFGILNLATDKPDGFKPDRQHFILTVDRSGSMGSYERDGMTKMQHIIHTIKNMMRYFVEELQDTSIYISVITFDDRVNCIIDKALVNNDNIKSLVSLVDDIYPRNMTNIGDAIMAANKQKESFTEEIQHTHILLTDGNPTDGIMSHNLLKECLDLSYRNILIGYGVDHNMYMLQFMSNYDGGAYYFVESAENAGNVYGEILHNILYEIMKNTVITIENAEIYDWHTNEWGTELNIGSVPRGVEKIFHIRYEIPNEDVDKVICLNFNYKKGSESIKDVMPAIGPDLDQTEEDFDVTKYTYRQKTMEILFKAKNKGHGDYVFDELRQEIDDLMKEISGVMSTREDLNDTSCPNYLFMQNLRDDIYVAEKSLHSRHGELFLGARRISQGDQRAYNVKNLDSMEQNQEHDADVSSPGPLPPLHKYRSTGAYQMSGAQGSPYACSDQLHMMRQCSQAPDNNN